MGKLPGLVVGLHKRYHVQANKMEPDTRKKPPQTTSQRVATYRKRQRTRLILATAEIGCLHRVVRSVLVACAPLLADADLVALARREEEACHFLRLSVNAYHGAVARFAHRLSTEPPAAEGNAHTPFAMSARVLRYFKARFDSPVERRERPPDGPDGKARQTPSQRVATYRARQRDRLNEATARTRRLHRVVRSVLVACAPLFADADLLALARREEEARRSLRLASLNPGLLVQFTTLLAIEPPPEPSRGHGVMAHQEWLRAHTPLALSVQVVRCLQKAPTVRPRGRPPTAIQLARAAYQSKRAN